MQKLPIIVTCVGTVLEMKMLPLCDSSPIHLFAIHVIVGGDPSLTVYGVLASAILCGGVK